MELNYDRFGERIKNLRKSRKMSIEELAQKVQYSAKSIVMVENGQASIGLEFFANLCTALDVAPNDLLEGEYRNSNTPMAVVNMANNVSEMKEMKELIESFKSMMKDGDEPVTINSDDVAIQKIKEMICDYKEQHRSKPLYKRR